MEYIVIPITGALEKARKDIVFGSNNPYNGQLNEVSEWAMIHCFKKYKVGQKVPFDKFVTELQKSSMDQGLSDLIDKGLIECCWDEKLNEIVFRAK